MAISQTPHAVAEQIGEAYVETERWALPFEDHPRTEQAYDNIANTIEQLFAEIPVPVQFQKADPYDDYLDMAITVGAEQKLRVYNQHTDHPYFSHMEQLAFRAVHDWFGHLEADVDFSPEGEFKKWKHMCQYFDTHEQDRVMFAEVVGQVGAVHYLSDGFADDRYQQRAFIAPTDWVEEMHQAVRE